MHPLSSAAAPSATSTRLSFHLDRSRINAGTIAHVSGILTRVVNGAALPGRSVALSARRTNQQTYVRVRQATTTTGGRYSFTVQPSWSTAYQVRFGGGPNRAPSASAYQILRVTGWYFMARLPAWSELGPRVDGGDFTATINGVEYPHSVQPGDVTFRGEEWVWKPNGRCNRLETYTGVPDSWTGEPLHYFIGASNGATATGTVSGHQPATHLVLDITAAASIHVLADNDFFPWRYSQPRDCTAPGETSPQPGQPRSGASGRGQRFGTTTPSPQLLAAHGHSADQRIVKVKVKVKVKIPTAPYGRHSPLVEKGVCRKRRSGAGGPLGASRRVVEPSFLPKLWGM